MPPQRTLRNEHEIDHHLLPAARLGHPTGQDRILSCRIRERNIMVCANEERTSCRNQGQRAVSVIDDAIRLLLHREATASLMLAPEMCGANRFDLFWD